MTQRVDYDLVAARYDHRYEAHRFDGIEAVLQRFVGHSRSLDVAEVGCGTGHWLAGLRQRVHTATGLDLSAEMLQRARTAAPFALIARGQAEHLPWKTGSLDRVFCINAMHHFNDPHAFLLEARRILRPGGALLIVGLDPHTALDQWWIYDYFPAALQADRARYQSTAAIRKRLEAIGFVEVLTDVAQHIHTEIPFAEAIRRGLVERHVTSQLMVITDAAYDEGLRKLKAEQPILRTELRLYATVAQLPASAGTSPSSLPPCFNSAPA